MLQQKNVALTDKLFKILLHLYCSDVLYSTVGYNTPHCCRNTVYRVICLYDFSCITIATVKLPQQTNSSTLLLCCGSETLYLL